MRIFRYLLGHKLALFIAVVLLVGQAFADLSIPKLTSDIVDVGIRQSGVEHAACDEVSARTYDVALMMSDGAGERCSKPPTTKPARARTVSTSSERGISPSSIGSWRCRSSRSTPDASAPGRLLSTISWMRTGRGRSRRTGSRTRSRLSRSERARREARFRISRPSPPLFESMRSSAMTRRACKWATSPRSGSRCCCSRG